MILTRADFVRVYSPIAKAQTAGSYIFPGTALAMAILESNNGKSKLTREANNFFGIKAGSKWTGETYDISTVEYDSDGKKFTEIAKFRKYPTPAASFRDFVNLISTSQRYAKALTASSATEQVKQIKEAGYSTDPRYVEKFQAVIDSIKGMVSDEFKKKSLS